MTQPPMLFGVILAGGEARRMGGQDKALLTLAGQPLLRHVQNRLAPQVARLALSANGAAMRFAGFELPVLADQRRCGPLGGILAGLLWAGASGADGLISVPVDAPFLPDDLVAKLGFDPQHPAYAQAGGRGHYACAYWPCRLAAPLAAFLASGAKPRIFDFLTSAQAQAVAFADASGFDNLNCPQDLADAEARFASSDAGDRRQGEAAAP